MVSVFRGIILSAQYLITFQPRTLEIEHFLGVANDIRNVAGGMPILKFHDPEDPHRVIKSSKMVEEVEPTPAFPVVRIH